MEQTKGLAFGKARMGMMYAHNAPCLVAALGRFSLVPVLPSRCVIDN